MWVSYEWEDEWRTWSSMVGIRSQEEKTFLNLLPFAAFNHIRLDGEMSDPDAAAVIRDLGANL
jgi:hypothetical protein